jgi:ribose transport system substrate-binding protein
MLLKNYSKLFVLILLVFSVACSSAQNASQPNPASNAPEATKSGSAEKTVFVGQSFPTYNNPWYVLFAKGSKDMAAALNTKIVQVTNPETSAWSPESQISQIENLIAQKPNVIEIDPTSTDGINPAIDEAKKQGIPVVVSGVHVSTDVSAAVTADNKQGAKLAGEYMAKVLNDKGKIAILLGTPGRDIIQNRENGFRDEIKKHAGIKIVSEQIANLERAKAVTVTENILQANPDIDAIWAANDEMALGALEAVRAKGLVGKIKIGGFDGTPDAVEAINKGEMQVSANQIPYEIGARAMAVSILVGQGKTPPVKDIVLPMNLITTENVKDYLSKQEENQKAMIETLKKEYNLQ